MAKLVQNVFLAPPLLLCILDGWGYSRDLAYNAIAHANTPFLSAAYKTQPFSLLNASGHSVGLPDGQMGNSEVGHATIGAGRVVLQDLKRINEYIDSNLLSHNKALNSLISHLKKSRGNCHIIGLASDGGVHSHIKHFISCISLFKDHNIKVLIHAITDGRDTPPKSAEHYINAFIALGLKLSTICGRFYAMDRDSRFERTKQYYDALVNAIAPKFVDPFSVLQPFSSDEFITPHVSIDYEGIKDGDAVLMINFREDRVRQIMSALFDPNFQDFKSSCHSIIGCGMTPYSERLKQFIHTVFSRDDVHNSLGEVLSRNNIKQLRVAETEKYAHVTYFFNNGREQPFEGEDRIVIPSPKVKTFDLCPEMSAHEITRKVVEAIYSGIYGFICINFANADMLGHTANFAATVKGCEYVDQCLSKIYKSTKENNWQMLITADHGNAEQLFDVKTGQSHTAHTLNKVPLIYFGNMIKKLRDGELQDIAPTILQCMSIAKPQEMKGMSLIV